MPTRGARPAPLTISELRSQVIKPLLFNGHRRRFEQTAEAAAEVASAQAPELRFTLPSGEAACLQLDAPTHEGNLAKFSQLLQELQAEDGSMGCQLKEVEALLATQAAQANLEGLWQLWHRAVYASMCDGRVLAPLLADALHEQVAPYVERSGTLLNMAGAYLALAVLGIVEPAAKELSDLCERRQREVAGKDDVLAGAYSHLGFELRSLQALMMRFIHDRQYGRSSLLVAQSAGALRSRLQEQHEDTGVCLGGEGAESLEALLWHLHEGPPADLHAWVHSLEVSLEEAGAQEERRLLFMASPTWQRGGKYAAVQSSAFLAAQSVALEVLCMTCAALDLADRLCPAGRRETPSAAATMQHRLLAVACAAHALVADPLHSMRESQSLCLEALLDGYAAALELADEVQRREGLLRMEEAEARADRAELLCRELQQQVAAQRKGQREVLRAQQQLTAAWFSVLETQMDLSKAQRSCLEEARRQFREAAVLLTAPELPPLLPGDPGNPLADPLLGSGSSSPSASAPPSVLQPSQPPSIAGDFLVPLFPSSSASIPALDPALAIHGGP